MPVAKAKWGGGGGRHSPGAISTAAVERRRRRGFSSPFLFFLSCLVSVFVCVCVCVSTVPNHRIREN